jgi:hypothetical protein
MAKKYLLSPEDAAEKYGQAVSRAATVYAEKASTVGKEHWRDWLGTLYGVLSRAFAEVGGPEAYARLPIGRKVEVVAGNIKAGAAGYRVQRKADRYSAISRLGAPKVGVATTLVELGRRLGAVV